MGQTIIPKPITKENFSKFGDLITTKDIKPITINHGYAKRYDNIAELDTAKDNGCSTIGFFGLNNGLAENKVDYLIKINSKNTAVIQEGHIILGHIICSLLDDHFVSSK